ncbi:MAG: MBL fold metallo-hydrolase [Pseudonocardiaceae bacterium]
MPDVQTAPPRSMIEVAEDIYAYIQPPGGWCLSNAGVIVGPDGALVVDTLATESRSRRLRDALDGLCPGPGRMLVNTHHHGDHIFGNQVFGPSATIFAHERARTEIAETGLALTTLWPDVEWGDIHVVLPTVTFVDRLTVYIGARRAELIHVGPAHTTNDVVVWLPDERILFAGDVVLAGATPFNLMGSVSGALTAIERLRELGPDIVVCGHGPVTGPEVFDENADYLTWIQRLAERGAAQGSTPLQLAQETDLAMFDHLLDPERIVGNLHRAYAELEGGPAGRPLDVVGVFGEMVKFNGGRLPTCLA